MKTDRMLRLEQLLRQKKISRRKFLSLCSAMGLSAALSPAILPNISMASDLKPQKGGVLRMGLSHGSTSDSLDPATQNNAMSGTMYMSMGNTFVELGPNNDLIPAIAESWEASADVKKWVFKLRQGVEFHNGKTVDLDDILATINHHRGEDSKSPVKSMLSQIKEIKTQGKDTIEFLLSDANADFPFIFADIKMTILPAKDGKADWKAGVGTGAYVLKEFEPGVRVMMERFPNFWNPDRGHFDQVELMSIYDMAARTNALRNGSVDLIDNLDLNTLHLLERLEGIKINEITSPGHYSLPMMTDVQPFDDNNVRLALKHAIDREALLKLLFKGHGSLGNDHPIGPNDRFYAANLPQREYDPDKARFYLKKAGVDNLTVSLHAAEAGFAKAVDTAVLYKEQASKAGIDINIVREPNDGYYSHVWNKKPWSMLYWRGRPTADWMFSTAYAAEAKWNDTHWKNKRFNHLLVQARSELDETKRKAMYVEMQTLVRNEGGVIIPIFNNYLLGHSDKLAHGPMLSYADLDGYKLPERWWRAAS